MIDIHTHVLPLVDDGSKSVESSIELVKEAVAQGVTHMFLTPHFRMTYKNSPKDLKQKFSDFVKKVKEQNIPIELYLGEEIYCYHSLERALKDNKVISVNSSPYILIEFDYAKNREVDEIIYDLTRLGYIPIVAHAERYNYSTPFLLEELRNLGALIQVNSHSIVRSGFSRTGKKAREFLKEGLVDFVASDAHSFRTYTMKLAYDKVCKKYGKEVADNLFINNAKKIIDYKN